MSGLEGVRTLAAGSEHALALMQDGTVLAWGENDQGQLGDGTNENSDVPTTVCAARSEETEPVTGCTQHLEDVVAISAR